MCRQTLCPAVGRAHFHTVVTFGPGSHVSRTLRVSHRLPGLYPTGVAGLGQHRRACRSRQGTRTHRDTSRHHVCRRAPGSDTHAGPPKQVLNLSHCTSCLWGVRWEGDSTYERNCHLGRDHCLPGRSEPCPHPLGGWSVFSGLVGPRAWWQELAGRGLQLRGLGAGGAGALSRRRSFGHIWVG